MRTCLIHVSTHINIADIPQSHTCTHAQHHLHTIPRNNIVLILVCSSYPRTNFKCICTTVFMVSLYFAKPFASVHLYLHARHGFHMFILIVVLKEKLTA